MILLGISGLLVGELSTSEFYHLGEKMALYFSSEKSSHIFKAQSFLQLLSAVCLCSEMTVSVKQICFLCRTGHID